jgi:putative nucleotidyltransferase with HDIG domain
MSIRILFVDDEPLLLSGLQRSLRPLRKEWSAAFAEGGEEALELLARQPFEVIVTDMRMPGMDGAALLNEVMRLYPDMLRLVLSGQSDLESVVKSAGVTHQYLAKPCSIEVLRDAVNRAVALHQLLADTSLKQLLSRLHSIPSVPPLYVELMNSVKSNQATIEKVSAIIQKDMGMSAKVLQLANSALGAAGRVTSTADAVVYLGLDAIRTLLLSLHAFSEFRPRQGSVFSLQSLWQHSLATGALAERIMQTLPADGGMHESMRMIGLLHDVGRLVLAANLPDAFDRAYQLAEEKHVPHWEAEREVFGATHAEVGAYLIGLWGLPEPIVEAVVYHHAPAKCPHPGSAMLTALHVADALASAKVEYDAAVHHPEPDVQYLAGMRLADRLPEWRELALQADAEEVSCG